MHPDLQVVPGYTEIPQGCFYCASFTLVAYSQSTEGWFHAMIVQSLCITVICFFFWNFLVLQSRYSSPCKIHVWACSKELIFTLQLLVFNLSRCQANSSEKIMKLNGVFTCHLSFMASHTMKRHCQLLTVLRDILHLKLLQR